MVLTGLIATDNLVDINLKKQKSGNNITRDSRKSGKNDDIIRDLED